MDERTRELRDALAARLENATRSSELRVLPAWVWEAEGLLREAAAALRTEAPIVEPQAIDAIAKVLWDASEMWLPNDSPIPWKEAREPDRSEHLHLAHAVAALYRGAPPETAPDGYALRSNIETFKAAVPGFATLTVVRLAYDGADVLPVFIGIGGRGAPEREASGWRSMDSAPKDGMVFRAYAPSFVHEDFNPSGSVECYYQEDEGFFGAVWNGEQDCWDAVKIKPTHWQPLPEPPAGAATPQQEEGS